MSCSCTPKEISYHKNGPHIGAYCANCCRWIRWVSKSEIRKRKKAGMDYKIEKTRRPVKQKPWSVEIRDHRGESKFGKCEKCWGMEDRTMMHAGLCVPCFQQDIVDYQSRA